MIARPLHRITAPIASLAVAIVFVASVPAGAAADPTECTDAQRALWPSIEFVGEPGAPLPPAIFFCDGDVLLQRPDSPVPAATVVRAPQPLRPLQPHLARDREGHFLVLVALPGSTEPIGWLARPSMRLPR